MSKRLFGLSAAVVVAASLASGPGAAFGAPVAGALAINNAAAPALEQVRWGGGGWGGRGWGGGGWGGGRGWGWGVGAGLLGGAIIGSALAAPYSYGTPYGYGYGYADPGYYAAPAYGAPVAAPGYGPGGDAVAYCSRRYRSYDPSSGTYLGYDGYRHPCP